MHRHVRWLLVAAALGGGLSAPLWGPEVLRRVPWFDVRRVEVSGTHLLPPHVVLATSGIRLGQSVWNDPAEWERALRAHPAIRDARVSRRLPHTLRVRVEEKRPVAYVEAETLHPATAAGELLPVDPARVAVDLPIVRARWTERGQQARARQLLAELGRLAELDPGLVAEVSEVRAGEAGPQELILSHRLAEISLPAGLESARLAQLRAVLSDLERRFSPAGGRAVPAARVDLRFQDQIVVRVSSSV